MPRVQLRVNGAPAEDWLADVSTEFPDAEFRILATQPTDDGLLEIAEVTTLEGDPLVRHFEDASEVRSYEVIHTDEQMVLIQFMIPISETYNALIASGIPLRYPVLLQDGWFSKEVTASQERLGEYTDELAATGIPYQVESLTQSHNSSELLTERQWEFVTEAVERGFYNTPRDCTLTELAEAFDINISAMSRLRHRAESRIITGFVAEAAP
ncbi:helix-turn-helix domain-containing protein [Haladaptatus sp. DYF46]|uniref:helix-turn-helix domain-containing protein n=1 Tax=Haladaptatus sp. DYF46 TaxID=2886041 RepID=UPI001E320560|nr:helix-turn-helix domain-containing protein [Haladaptatus sp. DYF46]